MISSSLLFFNIANILAYIIAKTRSFHYLCKDFTHMRYDLPQFWHVQLCIMNYAL